MDDENAEQFAKRVADRVAKQTGEQPSPAHCWFCGKVEAWFRCDCKDATDARAGKRNKPRWVEKDGKGYIILDPDVIAREHNQKRERDRAAKEDTDHAV